MKPLSYPTQSLGLLGCAISILFLTLSAGFAQDWPGNKNTRNFFEKHVPEAIVLFDQVMKEEGHAAYRSAMREAKTDMMDYQDVLDIEGEKAADLFIKELRNGYQIEAQLVKFAAAGEDKDAQDAVRKELLALSKKEHELYIHSLKLELKSFQEMAKEVERDIEAAERAGESNLNATVETLLESLKYSGPGVIKLLPDNWVTDFDKAMLQGKASKKPIVAVFSAGWCPPCQYMIKDVFSEKEVMTAMEHYVPVYIDVDKQRALKKDFNIRSVPTFFVLNQKGVIKKKLNGSVDPAAFEKWLRKK